MRAAGERDEGSGGGEARQAPARADATSLPSDPGSRSACGGGWHGATTRVLHQGRPVNRTSLCTSTRAERSIGLVGRILAIRRKVVSRRRKRSKKYTMLVPPHVAPRSILRRAGGARSPQPVAGFVTSPAASTVLFLPAGSPAPPTSAPCPSGPAPSTPLPRLPGFSIASPAARPPRPRSFDRHSAATQAQTCG